MTGTTRFAAAVVLSAIPAWAVKPGPQQGFRARTDVVTVAVSVRDGRHPVSGLTAGDFELLDNGVNQIVESVAAADVSLDVTMVLTGFRLESAPAHLQGLLSASRLQSLLRPDDRLRMVSVGDRVRAQLAGPADRVPTSHQQTRQIPGISLIDGLLYALAWPVEADRRHLVIAFTDGRDSYSTLAADRLPAFAARADAVMHVVLWDDPTQTQPRDAHTAPTPSGATTPPGSRREMAGFAWNEWMKSYRAVRKAAEQTGGSIRPASAREDWFQTVLDDFRASYLLRYSPAGVRLDGWHELAVRVPSRRSLTIRARKGWGG